MRDWIRWAAIVGWVVGVVMNLLLTFVEPEPHVYLSIVLGTPLWGITWLLASDSNRTDADA